MTVREKARKKEEKEIEDNTTVEKEHETATSSPLSDNETQIKQVGAQESIDREKAETKVGQKSQSLETLIPDWGTSEKAAWMYLLPTTEEGVKRWAKDWTDFLIEWADYNNRYVFSFSTFIREPPFCEMRNKRKAFSEIAESLIQQGLAEWRDDRKRNLQLMWKSKKEVADDLYAWALKTGTMHLDLRSMVIEDSFDFGGLPQEDIKEIFDIIVLSGRAEWVDKERAMIKLNT
ncbi:MAG: hypothetical protein R6V83_05120 [Candidatus Thorarchaeota archaeon]